MTAAITTIPSKHTAQWPRSTREELKINYYIVINLGSIFKSLAQTVKLLKNRFKKNNGCKKSSNMKQLLIK